MNKTIIIDAMSGDNAPVEIINGALAGGFECGCKLIFVGDISTIKETIQAYDGDKPEYSVVHTDSVVTMEDAPSSVMKEKSDSSLAVAVGLLAENKGDALVSAANTGALFTVSSIVLRRFKGVRRAALGAILPLEKPVLILDSGANTEILPEQLVSFAKMGEVYARIVLGLTTPRVGLLNNGAEREKGTAVCKQAYEMLEASGVNFCGNIEARDLPKGICDVVVTDGFTGNIAIKTVEGMAEFSFGTIKKIFTSSWRGKLAALLVRKDLVGLKVSMSPSLHGGAPFIGISKPVIKAHGAANAQAIRKTISQAISFSEAIEIMKENNY